MGAGFVQTSARGLDGWGGLPAGDADVWVHLNLDEGGGSFPVAQRRSHHHAGGRV